MPLVIDQLARRPGLIPVLVRWFVAEWEPYYGAAGPGDANADLWEALNRERLPIVLIALEDDDLVGTAALKATSLDSHRHLSPWLAAMLVRSDRRRRGIGTRLVAAVEAEARRLRFDALFTATAAGIGIMERRGWEKLDTAPTLRGPVPVYRCALGGPASSR